MRQGKTRTRLDYNVEGKERQCGGVQGKIGVSAEMTMVSVVIRGPRTVIALGSLLRRTKGCVVKHVKVPCERGKVGVVDVTVSTPRSVVDDLSKGVKELGNISTGATCSGVVAGTRTRGSWGYDV